MQRSQDNVPLPPLSELSETTGAQMFSQDIKYRSVSAMEGASLHPPSMDDLCPRSLGQPALLRLAEKDECTAMLGDGLTSVRRRAPEAQVSPPEVPGLWILERTNFLTRLDPAELLPLLEESFAANGLTCTRGEDGNPFELHCSAFVRHCLVVFVVRVFSTGARACAGSRARDVGGQGHEVLVEFQRRKGCSVSYNCIYSKYKEAVQKREKGEEVWSALEEGVLLGAVEAALQQAWAESGCALTFSHEAMTDLMRLVKSDQLDGLRAGASWLSDLAASGETGMLSHEDLTKSLLQLLTSQDEEVRLASMEAVGNLSAHYATMDEEQRRAMTACLPQVVSGLYAEGQHTRREATRGLANLSGALGLAEAIRRAGGHEGLVQAASQHQDLSCRKFAIQALRNVEAF